MSVHLPLTFTYDSRWTDAHLGQRGSRLVPAPNISSSNDHSPTDDLTEDLFEDAKARTIATVRLRLFVGVFWDVILEECRRRRKRV